MVSNFTYFDYWFWAILIKDWDKNGCVDFAEFVTTFTGWVDIDEEE
jgi:hypothetical protein